MIERHGALHVLVNNAGISPAGRPVEETDTALWERVLRVNLGGCFLCSKHAVGPMKRAGGGAIVNLASVAGLTGIPYLRPYAASKHGGVGLTRTLAVELAEHGIRVNAVAPGMTDTEMLRRGAVAPAPATVAAMERHTPLRRFAGAEEIAAAIAFLAGAGSAFVTGVVMPVDGGSLAGPAPARGGA